MTFDEEQAARAALVAEARSWLKTPYHHQGRVKGVGVDCAMILCDVYHVCGQIPAIDPRPYPHDWHLHRTEQRYLNWVMEYARPVQIPCPGDIVLYQFGRCISHGAIIVAWPTVIHAAVGEGCVLCDVSKDAKYLGRSRGIWRLHGFADDAEAA